MNPLAITVLVLIVATAVVATWAIIWYLGTFKKEK